ncbi:CDP-glycerol glycerophosphotransferase family protein [Butyrivibrio sp. XPD2006]|uniref:CDP-glycerol glycerophosphotransferase family protein n=1 Tax=Butyrivibrio sp. XPD2006 TaxID=1280668 RepID=UPI0003B57A3B|nr:CDP-glycerol glycerophosphotransferase family protein [Butyrivibrio sp. XPD2006]
MDFFKVILRPFRVIFILLCKLMTGLVPKDKRLVLFGAWFGQRYADNTKYLYEFCLNKKDIKPIWFTKNYDVYRNLISQGKPAVYSKSLKGILVQMRAAMLVSTVDYGDFNIYLLSGCMIFDQGHGVAIKRSHDKGYETCYQKFFDALIHLNVKRYGVGTNPYLIEMAHDEVPVPDDHVIYANMARTDVFFDERLYDHRNDFLNDIIKDRKVVLYAPTHRLEGAIPIEVDKIFDLPDIQEICEQNNAVFIIKKHFYHKDEKSNLDKYSRIFDITNEDVETQSLLCKTDILISDYSAIYIDFLATNRPIILYPYDYKEFTDKIRGFFLCMEDNHVGYKPNNPAQITDCLKHVFDDPTDEVHQTGRDELRNKYYNPGQKLGTSRQYLYEKMLRLLNLESQGKIKNEEQHN